MNTPPSKADEKLIHELAFKLVKRETLEGRRTPEEWRVLKARCPRCGVRTMKPSLCTDCMLEPNEDIVS